MKVSYFLALLGAALVTGCAYEPVYTTPAPVAVAPAVSPAYVVPSNTVVVPSGTVIR